MEGEKIQNKTLQTYQRLRDLDLKLNHSVNTDVPFMSSSLLAF